MDWVVLSLVSDANVTEHIGTSVSKFLEVIWLSTLLLAGGAFVATFALLVLYAGVDAVWEARRSPYPEHVHEPPGGVTM